MQGSYFHHLFLLCIWLLVKAPQLGCDAVSISDQCWQNCSLAVNVSRSTAKPIESPETCYKECLKKRRNHQFAGNEQGTALSRRIKRASNVISNSRNLSGEDCGNFRKNYSSLLKKDITVTLEYIPSARGLSSYNASISWNVLPGLKSNWTQGYIVSYVLQTLTDEPEPPVCWLLPEMNTSFASYNFPDKDLIPNESKLYVMVISVSHEGPGESHQEQFAVFKNEAITSRVRTGKECDEFPETMDFIPKKNIQIELNITTTGYYNTIISWKLESDWRYMIVYKLDGLVNDTRTPTFCRAVKKETNSIRLGRLDVPNKLLLAKRSRILVAVTSLSKKSHGTERVRNGSQYQIAYFFDAINPSTSSTEIVSTSPNVTIDPSSTERKTLSSSVIVAMCVAVAFVFLVVVVVIWWRFGGKKNKEEDVALLDSGFKFDAFIIYSTTDEKWVKNKLLSTLEKKHNIKCCIHYRDFLPGVPFVENMAQSVYNSRKTIAVVSKSFLGSNYCNHELNIALHRLAERGDNSVIVIKLDDVGNSDLPIELQCRSYIDFTKATDKKTWEYKLVHSFRGERC